MLCARLRIWPNVDWLSCSCCFSSLKRSLDCILASTAAAAFICTSSLHIGTRWRISAERVDVWTLNSSICGWVNRSLDGVSESQLSSSHQSTVVAEPYFRGTGRSTKYAHYQPIKVVEGDIPSRTSGYPRDRYPIRTLVYVGLQVVSIANVARVASARSGLT